LMGSEAVAGWKIDLSRRQDEIRKREMQMRQPASTEAVDSGIIDSIFSYAEPMQEIVVINTQTGFIPNTLNLQKGKSYKIHVVNVNEELKNVSFVLDTFSQHHSTYYGEVKSFPISPKKEGVYSFVCPETSAQGKLVVYTAGPSTAPQVEMRTPASE
jgi:plastocyanin domain-containing protein